MNKKNTGKVLIQEKAKKLQDSMDVTRALSKTWKDQPENIYNEKIITNLDELENAIKDLKKEIKSGKK